MSYPSSEGLAGSMQQGQLALDWHALIQAVGDAVICADRAGILIFWNPGAERLFGFSAEEAVGESLDLIIPSESRTAHWDAFYQAMRLNQTRLGTDVIRVPMLRKDQSRFKGALTVGIVRGEGDRIERIGAIIREELASQDVQS